MSSVENEQEAIIRCIRGDKESFEIIVRNYMKQSYAIALGYVGNHDDAMDLSQEAFIRAYGNIKKFNPECRFFPWFYQILKNLCFNYLKRKRSRVYVSVEETAEKHRLPSQCSDYFDPGVIVERNETKERVWEAIGKLGEKHREIIILRHFQNMSYDEIAEVLFCNRGTVMSRLYYARKALKEILEHDHDGGIYDEV